MGKTGTDEMFLVTASRARKWGAELGYYPYGEERQVAAQNKYKFGTYYRDPTGLDYADQRYYSSVQGRFMTADPSDAGDQNDPQSLGGTRGQRRNSATAHPLRRLMLRSAAT